MQIVELPFLVDNANEAGLVVQRLHDAGHQTGLGAVKLPNMRGPRRPTFCLSTNLLRVLPI